MPMQQSCNATIRCDAAMPASVRIQGHRGRGNQWIYNNYQSLIDLAYRAPHVTAVAGKAIVQSYYGRAPQKSYYMGCSAGGRGGLMLAQRFRLGFDGIIAGAPAIGTSGVLLSWLWGVRALADADGRLLLTQADLDMLNRAVVKHCDLNDGVADGLIGDPRQCDFDPTKLLCISAMHGQCLSAEKIAAVRKVYGGPVTSQGNGSICLT